MTAILLVLAGTGVRAQNTPNTIDAAIQAVQQAPDPSAAVAAYANGVDIARNNPRLYDAYVSRMVDLGLPEMAYHQAQTLTTLQSNNGLAWGVVAYVDARKAEMPEAVSAINLAGQFAPDSKFVQHTAGEIVAWYDLKADKAAVPDSAKNGLVRVRSLLGNRPEFTQAYSTAQKAYQGQASPSTPPPTVPSQVPEEQAGPTPAQPASPVLHEAPLTPQAQVAQSAAPDYAYAAPLAAPDYGYAPPPAVAVAPYADSYAFGYPSYSSVYLDWAPDYCYDWGPGWVAPEPWCWWQPCGFWSGLDFSPFGGAFAFGDFDDFHHHGFFGHDRFGHDGRFGRDGRFGGAFGRGGHDPALWHHDGTGRNGFFGTPAGPRSGGTQWARTGGGLGAGGAFLGSAGNRWWNGSAQRGTVPARFPTAPHAGSFPAQRGAQRGGFTSARTGVAAAPSYRSWTPNTRATWSAPAAGRAWAPQNSFARNYSSLQGGWARPGFGAPAYAAPRSTMPATRSFGAYGGFGGWRGGTMAMNPRPQYFGGGVGGFSRGNAFGGFRGGGFSPGGGFRGGGFGGGGFHAGGSFGGGFHGGSFGGGGFHGGGGGGFHGGGGGGGGFHGGGGGGFHGGGGHR